MNESGNQSDGNKAWFSREGAFDYLETDVESKIRIAKVMACFENIRDASSSRKLLDIGCAGGVLGEKFIEMGYDVYGVDISDDLLGKAREKGVQVKESDVAEGLPYDNDTFDYVFAGEIIEHIVDTEFVMNEIKRVIRPGGHLVVTTPNLANLSDRLLLLRGRAPSQTRPTHEYLKFHVRQFTHFSMERILRKYGFEVLKSKSTTVVFERDHKNNDRVRSHSRLLARLFPSLGESIIILAQG